MQKLLAFIVAFQSKVTELTDKKDRGATATEYALLVALIAIAIVVAVTAFGSSLASFFTALGTKISGWAGSV